MNEVQALGPRAKLALSRAKLMGAMGYQQINDPINDALENPVIRALPTRPEGEESATVGSHVARWWRRQPASTAFKLLQPGLERYARRNPGRLVAYSAGAGSLLVVLRPWRLLSLGAVVALVFKATDIASAVTSVLRAPETAPRQDTRTLSAVEARKAVPGA